MVNIPSGVSIPGADKAVIDIASKLRALPNKSCGFGTNPIYFVVTAKPTNSELPLLVPVSYATISLKFNKLETKQITTDVNGIASYCYNSLGTYLIEIKVSKSGYTFPDWTNVEGVMTPAGSAFKVVNIIQGDAAVSCPIYTPSIGVANFDKLTSTPTVFTQPANLNFSGYGTIPLSGTYEVKVNGTSIGSGNVENGKVNFSYPGAVSNLLTKFPSLKSPAKIDLIIKMGNCTFTNSTTISLPSLTPIMPVCTPPQIYNPLTKQCETPVIPRCTPPQIYNPITKQCETPSVPGCSQLVTTVESLNHPAEITDFLAPFYVYLRGVKEVCKADPTNPSFIKKLPKGTMGTITLGNLSSNFYLTDDGIIDIDLSKLINLPSLAGVTGGVTPPPVAIVQPSLPPVAGERVGSYCTLAPYQAFGQTWYKVVHDTVGQISSGDTYSVAKHKAEAELRCFPKPVTVPCITITGEPYSVRGKNVYYRFKATPLAGMYAEGSWRDDTATLAQNQEKAINLTLAFYNRGYFQKVYGREMKRTDICGQR